MKIISHSSIETRALYFLFFQREGDEGSGFGFDCDAQGNVDETKLTPAGLENYRACRAGTNGTCKPFVQDLSYDYRVPAIGECPCGRHVTLERFTNTCECGRDFNSSGQELASREQWGEETDEHWTECY